MKLHYDLHIHTALSPCADRDMTPGNLVAMAKLKGLQIIAVTDHQSCANCAAVLAAAERQDGPVVLPGLEIESAEEIHLLCLLPDLPAAQAMERAVQDNLPDLPNRPEIFGDQLIIDDADHITGQMARLLLQPCSLDSLALADLALQHGGVLIPAHVDRDAYSMLRTLGTIPADYPSRWLEFTRPEAFAELGRAQPYLASYKALYNSDAHHLGDIAEAGPVMELPCLRRSSPDKAWRQAVVAAVLAALRH